MSWRNLPAFAGLAFLLALAVPARTWGQVTQASQNIDPAITAQYEAQIRGRLSEVEEVRRNSRTASPLTADGSGIAPVISPEQQAAINRGNDQPLSDSRGTELAPTTVVGLLLIRDMFILQANWMADYLQSIRDGGVGDKRARLQGMREVSRELARMHAELQDAELAYNQHLGSLGEAGQISEETARQHTQEADRLNREAQTKKQVFQQALDEAQAQFPEINGAVDGVPLWQALDGVAGRRSPGRTGSDRHPQPVPDPRHRRSPDARRSGAPGRYGGRTVEISQVRVPTNPGCRPAAGRIPSIRSSPRT